MTEPSTLFNNEHVQHNFSRAAGTFAAHSPVHYVAAQRLLDRLKDTKRTFKRVLECGAGTGTVAQLFPEYHEQPEHYMQVDSCADMLSQNPAQEKMQLDIEQPLPFAERSFDLVLSNMLLPWLNDVPAFLLNAGKCLVGDGLFMASALGVESFPELRQALHNAGWSDTGHIVPLPDVQQVGMVLMKVKFALPVVDRDMLTLTFDSPQQMLQALRQCGARNLHPARSKGLTTPRQWQKLITALEVQRRPDGKLPLTVEILYITAWRPHSSQQKPLAPGSAQVMLSDALKGSQ